MNDKASNEKLDKIIKRLDIITVVLLKQAGFKRKEIADALGVSEKTIQRLVPVSKINGSKVKKIEIEEKDEIEKNVDGEGDKKA